MIRGIRGSRLAVCTLDAKQELNIVLTYCCIQNSGISGICDGIGSLAWYFESIGTHIYDNYVQVNLRYQF